MPRKVTWKDIASLDWDAEDWRIFYLAIKRALDKINKRHKPTTKEQ